MSFKMFRAADPTRRTPTYLQAYTRENAIWQLKLTGIILLGLYLWGEYEDYQWAKTRNNVNDRLEVFSHEID